MLTFAEFLVEKKSVDHHEIPWEKNPKIGWWKDHDHVTLYHGTHDSRVASIRKHGLKAPEHGPTKGNISLTLDNRTAHAYASMSGGESAFRAAGAKANHTPHEHRSVLHYRVPRAWLEKHMDPHLKGNMNDHLTNKEKYLRHAASGQPDHKYYETTEFRVKHLPHEYLIGHSKKV